MSKSNETDRWAVESEPEPEPKQLWLTAAGVKSETFTWWSRSLKFGFPFHSPGLWGKRVNLLRDERGLPYVYIVILVYTGMGRGGQGDWLNFEIWKMFVFQFRVGKIKFIHCWPPWKNAYNHHLEKATIVPLPCKNPSDAEARLCVDLGFLNFFAHIPIYHFATLHPCWCNNTSVQIRQWLSVFDGPNHFGAGVRAKNFGRLAGVVPCFGYCSPMIGLHKIQSRRGTDFSCFGRQCKELL